MRLTLKDFQKVAVDDLSTRVRQAASIAGPNSPQAVVLSAPTGAGKTVIATRLIERILEGDDEAGPDSDAVFLWITDLPELNRQTYNKMINTSDVLSPLAMEIIDSSFNHRMLSPGRIYYLNTQKLGRDKLLTTLGDRRQYTIWQTLDNTIKHMGARFMVIIDEAHRGMRTRRDEKAAVTIIQKFLKGSDEMRQVPLVLGISATPQRFNNLVAGTRTVHPVHVGAADVRASGLLKERIVLHHSADDQQIDITLLREATRHWHGYTQRWAAYCAEESEQPVVPLFIVQVENAPRSRSGTRTDLATAIRAINEELPRPLPNNAFAHAFDESTALDADGFVIRYLAPSRIASDRDARVVFFKTALSTGWDCPQAETMMSYRKAQDATYIAQLIGRMVRTPLARRVEKDESLNSVSLFLPHYDAKGVASVVDRLTDSDHEFVPPTPVQPSTEAVTLHRADGSEPIFKALAKLRGYTVPTRRKIKQVRRMMSLALALVQDGIHQTAIATARSAVWSLLQTKLDAKRADQTFVDQVHGKALVSYGTRVFDLTRQEFVNATAGEVAISPENLNDLFDEAGRRIGEGLHRDFWQQTVAGVDDIAIIRHAKIEVAVLLCDPAIVEEVENLARYQVDLWRSQYVDQIDSLPEKRHSVYAEVAGSAHQPSKTKIRHPERVAWRRPTGAPAWDKHIYVDDDGAFADDFNNLESEVLNAEIPNCLGWLRNPDRKNWSFTIPYERRPGEYKPVYPDFLFFRQEGDRVVIDILDPHGAHLPDAVTKAKGLALYAQTHGHHFGRIETIDRIDGQLRRLNLKDHSIRDQLNTVTNNDGLAALYKARANNARC
ncbi:DEAD/DEAH box helicase [Candidatus Spongiisocius sp.]|uniref:DEAD/DEAH box helicase n=1 Tax=Candidatus Spongiisocius sp. TaxID=3101273 RepID=UPI003B5A71F2